MNETELQQKTRQAFVWNIVDRIGAQLIAVAISIALARLLGAAEYGLIGALAIFTALSSALTDSGFSYALVRKTDITDDDYNTVFYYNLVIALILYAAGYACAPLIARFFGEPLLIPVSRVLFIVFILNALCLIQNAKFVKEIDFKKITLINIIAIVTSGIAALAIALAGGGVWALVAQTVTQSLVKTILQWILGKWRPRLVFSTKSFKEMFAFGSNLMIANVLNVLFLNLYSAIIGRIYSNRDLGYYTQADKWSNMGITAISGVIQNSTYTIFSKLQHDKTRLLRSYRKTMQLTAFIAFPTLIGLAFMARPFVLILLGDKWAASIPMFSLLLIAGIFSILSTVNGNYIRIAGNSRTVLRLEIFKIILFVIVLARTWHLPIIQLMWGMVATRALVYVASIIFIGRQVGYPWHQQLHDIMPSCGISLLMICFAYPVSFFVDNIYLLFILQASICILFYWIVNRHIQLPILNEVIQNIKR